MDEKEVPNAKIPTAGSDAEKDQAQTDTAIREGQEDSSILHDKDEPNRELFGEARPKIDPSTNQEEFIDDDKQNR